MMIQRTSELPSPRRSQDGSEKASKKQLRQRRSQIVRELSDLSRDGWSRARFGDYTPLEAELNAINERL